MKRSLLVINFLCFFCLINISGQVKSSQTTQQKVRQYTIVDYDAPEPEDMVERDQRSQINKRYDKRRWVVKNPNPNDSGVGCFDCVIVPPPIPADESNLVIIGEIVGAKAFLSNDKRGIYSEYEILIEEILKKDNTKDLNAKDSVSADRAGGIVRYSSGQEVFYEMADQELPRTGGRYLFFLNKPDQSPNYNILVGYELPAKGKIHALDSGAAKNYEGLSETEFLKKVRETIAQ